MIYSSYQDKLGDSSQFIDGNLSASNQFSLSVIAASAIQVAAIMEEQNRLAEAQYYVAIAMDKYKQVHGEESELTIGAQWLMLQITYSQSK